MPVLPRSEQETPRHRIRRLHWAAVRGKPVFSSSPGHVRRLQQSNMLSVGVKREEREENPGGNWWLERHRTTSTVRHAFPTTPGPGSLNAMPKLSFLGYLRLTGIIAFSTAKVPEMIAAFPSYLFLTGLHPCFSFPFQLFLALLSSTLAPSFLVHFCFGLAW